MRYRCIALAGTFVSWLLCWWPVFPTYAFLACYEATCRAAPGGRPTYWLAALLLLALLLPSLAARAQNAPPVFAGASSGNNFQPTTGTSVARATATGNVYVTGSFTGQVTFGSTRLVSVSAGSSDVFVAKWDAAAQAWTSAVSGGGGNADQGLGIAVRSAEGVASVYVTGYYSASATLAGTALTAVGNSQDVFVAKYTDSGAGLSTTSGGAVSGAGQGNGVAVASAGGIASVYVTGYYNGRAIFADAPLATAGGQDVFVAKYTDSGSGLSTDNGGAVGGGGTSTDQGNAVAIARQQVYVGGYTTPSATFGPTTLASPASSSTNVLARVVDATLAPLPVQLVQFAATASGPTAVRLTWATASEVNSAYFAVARRADGTAWQALGRVAAAGSSASAHQYTYLDGAAPVGTSYYRLRQVDQDGTAAYSPVQSVTRSGAGLALYPNPARGGAALLSGAAPGAAVWVLDALGRPVGTAALPRGVAPGVYVVRVGTQAVKLTVE